MHNYLWAEEAPVLSVGQPKKLWRRQHFPLTLGLEEEVSYSCVSAAWPPFMAVKARSHQQVLDMVPGATQQPLQHPKSIHFISLNLFPTMQSSPTFKTQK